MKGSRAITAGVVGSVLFFVAAIILSVCAVKICNKRKQRKMEKGMCVFFLFVFLRIFLFHFHNNNNSVFFAHLP